MMLRPEEVCMIKKNISQVPVQQVTMEGVEKTSIQWIFKSSDGAPGFAMRRFVMAPGGKIPLHDHGWEHEIYILSGRAVAFTPTEKQEIGPGDALLLPPGEPHGYENHGPEDLVFLCLVPLSAE